MIISWISLLGFWWEIPIDHEHEILFDDFVFKVVYELCREMDVRLLSLFCETRKFYFGVLEGLMNTF